MSQSTIHPELKRVMKTTEPDDDIPIIVRYRREPGVATCDAFGWTLQSDNHLYENTLCRRLRNG